jgi:hydrogenase maturation factor HypF (carbamoyltransferase family)
MSPRLLLGEVPERRKLVRGMLAHGANPAIEMKLLARTLAGLRKLEFEVFIHAQVPPNDGGIALGQAVIATETLRQR